MHKNIARGFAAVAAGAALSAAGISTTSTPGAYAKAAPTARVHSVRISHRPPAPGTQLWIKRFNGSGITDNFASSVAASPGGGTVFVTGTSMRAGAGTGRGHFATVAYKAATGARLWIRRYRGPGHSFDIAASMAVSPGGLRVFVTGSSATSEQGTGNYATIAYNAATGAPLWARSYSGPGNSDDGASSVAVSPGGRTVFVTGGSANDYATVAYSAATGARLWVRRYNGPGNSGDAAASVTVGPGGGRVFVTGTSGNDYATVAYSAATGARLWVSRYKGPGGFGSFASSVAVSPLGGRVFVTGTSATRHGIFGDYATVAYNAATGARLWVRRYRGPGHRGGGAASVAVGPRGGRVFITGTRFAPTNGSDYTTIAYSG